MSWKKCEKEQQLKDQALIQYYIFEDFQNLINLLYQLQTVSEYFQNNQNNEIVILSRNKVISQLNISNLLHFDIQQNCNDKDLIKREKQKVEKLISQLPNQIKNQYLKLYQKNSLSDNIQFSQQPLEKINIPHQFNQQVVSTILSSMQLIDKNIGQIQSQNQYQIPKINDIIMKAEKYQTLAQSKLQATLPKMQQFKSQIQGNEKQYDPTQQSLENPPQNKQYGQPTIQNNQNSNYIHGYKNLGNK